MSSIGSVTAWLQQFQKGSEEAFQRIWESYYPKLLYPARNRIRGTGMRVADEDDVVSTALYSFLRGVEKGRFPKLGDRSDLWRVLVLLTQRRVRDFYQHETRQKRSPGPGTSNENLMLEQAISRDPTPEFAAQVTDELHRLLNLLDSEELRSIALWKMEGYTNREIATKLDCVERTIERKYWVIKNLWDPDPKTN